MAFNRKTLTTVNVFKKTRDKLKKISEARTKEQHRERSMVVLLDEAVEDFARKESERLKNDAE